MAVLFYTVQENLKASIIIKDMGESIYRGAYAIIAFQIIFCVLLFVLTLFSKNAPFVIEKHLYLQYLIFMLMVCSVFDFGAQVSVTGYYDTIQEWIDKQCIYEPITDANNTVDDFSFSSWHDYDFIYQINDYMANKTLCNSQD